MTFSVVFPGQGSQSVGMLKDIAQAFPEINETFSQASDVLNYDLWKLVQLGPTEELDKTARTQPALLTASYALWRILKNKKNIQPAMLAGHSLGEYTALVCAEALTFRDAVKIVAARGEYMQEAVPVGQGALAVIVGLENDVVAKICNQAKLENEVLSPANFNSPGQIVIAGHTKAVERALVLAQEADARMAKLLPVSVPSHCSLMKPAAERLMDLLKKIPIQQPKIPVVANVDVETYSQPENIREGLTKQLFMPVRWIETVQAFEKAHITQIIECGPGKVLCGLNKRITSSAQLANTADLSNLQNLLQTL